MGGRESRLDKIVRLIEGSRWSIHDVSRVELSPGPGGARLPRFNMPFECGLAFGAMRFGGGNARQALVMSGVAYQDKAALSDLAGIDPGYHGNDPARLIAEVRRFLAASRPGEATRGHRNIHTRLLTFRAALPAALRPERKTLAEVESLAYINDWLRLAVAWMKAHPR